MRFVSRLNLDRLGSNGRFETRAEALNEQLLEWWRSEQQSRPPFDIVRMNDVARPLLQKQFDGKCVYCEVGQQSSQHDIELFRPKSRYWWLACDWKNFYLACQRCNRTKRDRFPLHGGTRAEKPEDDISLEEPALLDPCADDPRHHLKFLQNGIVEPVSKRGSATIEVLELNRSELVKARRNALEWMIGLVDRGLFPDLMSFVGDDAEYAGVLRAYLIDNYSNNPEVMEVVNTYETVDMALSEALEETQEGPIESREIITAEEIGLDNIRIKWIKITNFKSFSGTTKIRLHTSTENRDIAAWMVLLGENGAGKSSLLEAIAIGLAPSSFLAELDIDDYLPITRNKAGRRKTASIQICLDKEGYELLEVRINTTGFKRNIEPPERMLVRAFGATRLSEIGQHGAEVNSGINSVDNLFDPDKKLSCLDAWLRHVHDQDAIQFRNVATEVLALLPQGLTQSLDVVKERVVAVQGKEAIPLRLLSGGYQGILGIAAELISAVPIEHLGYLDQVPGIVILDEIGSHLHPRWRMQIVEQLKRVFPKMQFIVSTHEPLCLRNVGKDEIRIVMSGSSRVTELTDEDPDPAYMRVDQLLTSPLFGLDSTIDPKLEEDFQKYYWLHTNRDPNNAEQTAEYETLKRTLSVHNTLAYTRRDQIIYEIIDDFLAEEKFKGNSPQSTRINGIPKEVKEKVVSLWRYASARVGTDASD